MCGDRFNYRILRVNYITNGWYGCVEIDRFQAPVTFCTMFPSTFIKIAKNMLQLQNLIKLTIENYKELIDAESQLKEQAVLIVLTGCYQTPKLV
ncbi:15414_t:CDS:2 [Entrophospora sp. SA101]|nr:15414_t:CDS:2 [Entrophospora sp. SA101]